MGDLGFARRRLIDKIVLHNWGLEKPELKQYSYDEILFIVQEMMNNEGKFYMEGGSIGRGYHVFREFTKYLLYRNLANFDSMLLITAPKGIGKSSAAIMIARQWCKLIGISFNPDRHIAYNNNDVVRKIDQLNKFEPIICVGRNTKIQIKENNIEHMCCIKNLVDKNNYEVLTYNIKKNIFEYQKPQKTIFTKKEKTYRIYLTNKKK